MVALPQPTIDRIFAVYEKRNADSPRRQYLGGSEIGEQCSRRLWYSWRHADREQPPGRVLRLFQTGHREELRIIEDLRAIGCTVWDVDPATGQQWRYTALDGHLSIGLDGVVLGLLEAPETPHILECKTSNARNFAKLQKEGVEKAKPVHYAQAQLGMGLADLTRAAYVVVEKDTDQLYLERINFDDKVFKALLLKAKRIINAESAPEKISKDPAFWVCRYCPYADLCHGERVAEVSCRSCVHSAPAADAKWECAQEQKMEPGCNEHLFIPDLVPFAEPVDGDPSFIQYKMKDGRGFINCAATGFPSSDLPHFSSSELAAIDPRAIGDPAVEAARTILDGKVVER